MLNRREFMVGAVAVSSLGRPARRAPITTELVIRNPARPATQVLVVLKNADVGALTGIGANRLSRAVESCRPAMTVEVEGTEALVRWEPTRSESRISLRNGCESFLAAWALPVIDHGIIGYSPHEDLPALLAQGPGEFWQLSSSRSLLLPITLRSARAAYGCFFGFYGLDVLSVVDTGVRKVQHAQPFGAEFIFTVALQPDHEPSFLMTTFAA
jgi:hypothetical protein